MYCKELDKDFSNKKELFKALKANVNDIINVKKSQILKSYEKGIGLKAIPLDVSKIILDAAKNIDMDDAYCYIAVNTTKILDGHYDMHVNGIWNKTVKEQQGKNYLVTDHEVKMNTIVVRKEHIEMFVAEIPFSAVGKPYEGMTQALIYKFPKDQIRNPEIKEWIESGDAFEASVRMQYVKIELAMDSSDKGDEKYKQVYDKYIKEIANKQDFEMIDYFWVVSEAKQQIESSLVPFGSNPATGRVKDILEAVNDTSKEKEDEAVESTLQTSKSNFYLKQLNS